MIKYVGAFAVVLMSVFGFQLQDLSAARQTVHANEDTMAKFKCSCGNKVETSNLVSVPIASKGRVYYKTYFTFTPFLTKFFDYITLVKDTVFIIRGSEDIFEEGSFANRQVLCILTDCRRTYKREKLIGLPFFNCFIYKGSRFDRKTKSKFYSFCLQSCGYNPTSDLPFVKEITFTEKGKIAAFLFDNVDSVWDCKSID
jgi:hypothetical protein